MKIQFFPNPASVKIFVSYACIFIVFHSLAFSESDHPREITPEDVLVSPDPFGIGRGNVADLSSVSIEFERPVTVTGIRPEDLLVNNHPAKEMTVNEKGIYIFTGYSPPVLGKVEIVLKPGKIRDLKTQAPFVGGSWIRQLFDPQADNDGDGLTNEQEIITAFSDPTKVDTDEDGLPDPYEFSHSKCLTVFRNEALPENAYGVIHPGTDDSDGDGLSNLAEFQKGSDPCNAQDK